MPFKENGRIITELHVDEEKNQSFVRKGDIIALGCVSHPEVARKNGITPPIEDAGAARVLPNEIILIGGSHGFKIERNKESPERKITVKVFQSLTSKAITSI